MNDERHTANGGDPPFGENPEGRYAKEARPPGSLSPRYGVTAAERQAARAQGGEVPMRVPLRPLGRPRDDRTRPGELVGPADHKLRRQFDNEKRREQVLVNWISGMPLVKIAEALDVPEWQVKEDIKTTIERMKREGLIDAQQHTLKIVRRNELMINAVFTRALNGDMAAQKAIRESERQIMRALRIGEPEGGMPGQLLPGSTIVAPGGTINNVLVMKSARELSDEELALVAQVRGKVKQIEALTGGSLEQPAEGDDAPRYADLGRSGSERNDD